MTDQATDFSTKPSRSATALRWEYRVYFALIFLLALPFALADVLLAYCGLKAHRRQGNVLQRAWAEANAITPMIFMH
ncbi:cytochrome PufQ [Phaeobacter sp.]|uniref:cytochrome PufQ n=1 Tax=Phaeobacter sp. TaxID=1902409 RepID=UPI0025FB7DF6|nr:cytochrome PufQ [Phaeobacter sp.]